ncbi:MAG: hypothetical protein HON90_14645 [Halobacteriovoraceae bacterium]|nr:hypothetical protein [Halobacteriovoraceae bacterium]
MDKKLTIMASSLAVVVVLTFTLSGTDDSKPARSFSVYHNAVKVNKSFTQNNILLASEVKSSTDNSKSDYLKVMTKKHQYFTLLNKQQSVLANNLKILDQKHQELISKMKNEGIKIDALTNLKPRLTIALSYLLNLQIQDLTEDDIKNLKFSNQEWYLLKTFSESKDFKVLLKRKMLTSDFVQFESLNELYGPKNEFLAKLSN